MKHFHETNKTMMDFFIKNKSFFADIAKKAVSICGKARVLTTSFVGGSIAYLSRDCGYDIEKVEYFFSQLCNTDTSENITINTLRKRLFEDRNNRKNKSLNKIHCALTTKCWNAFVTKKQVKTFNWNYEKEGYPKYMKTDEL